MASDLPYNCNMELQAQGKPYPRRCAVCGVGRCPFSLQEEPAKPGKMLLPFQRRVIEEAADLEEKLTKLNAFLHSETSQTIPVEDELLMRRQFTAMSEYLAVLKLRIERF